MQIIKKAFGYVTRFKEGQKQVLVFQHSIPEAGIQIPKGTVEPGESTYDAVIREVQEETGLDNFTVEAFIAEDLFEYKEGVVHHRFFYEIQTMDDREAWDYKPTGGGGEIGLTFHFFWIHAHDEVKLVKGHGDYLNVIFEGK